MHYISDGEEEEEVSSADWKKRRGPGNEVGARNKIKCLEFSLDITLFTVFDPNN